MLFFYFKRCITAIYGLYFRNIPSIPGSPPPSAPFNARDILKSTKCIEMTDG